MSKVLCLVSKGIFELYSRDIPTRFSSSNRVTKTFKSKPRSTKRKAAAVGGGVDGENAAEKTQETAAKQESTTSLRVVPSRRRALMKGPAGPSPCVVIADVMGGHSKDDPDYVYMFAGLNAQVPLTSYYNLIQVATTWLFQRRKGSAPHV